LKIKHICKQCGKEFEILLSRVVKYNKGKFCCKECFRRYLKDNPPHKGKLHSDESKKKISDTHRGIKHPFYGKRHSYESKLKITEYQVGGFWYGNVIDNENYKYCEKFNGNFKERVRSFWYYKCFICDEPQHGKKLAVHHIHYDKKMCCNGSPQDCVPLCNACHSATNSDRDIWEDFLTKKLYSIYPDGKCFFTKDEMRMI